MGDIILTRKNQEFLKLFDYNIYIDDKMVNTIKNGTTKVISLKEGNYEMHIKVGVTKSEKVNVKIEKNKSVRLSIGSKMDGMKYLFSYFYIFSKGLLKIENTKI